MGNVKYRYIRYGVVEERVVATIGEALSAAIHDMEVSYAAPVAIIDDSGVAFDSKAIRSEYSKRFAHEEGRPAWKNNRNGAPPRRFH